MAYKDKEVARLKNKEWWDNNQDKIITYREEHAEERNDYSKEYHKNHREKCNKRSKKYRRKNKALVIGHYSHNTLECTRCSYSDIRALQIDHIDGGGEAHRRTIKQDFYVWLIKNNYPQGFQVLCANCQILKAWENKEYTGRLRK